MLPSSQRRECQPLVLVLLRLKLPMLEKLQTGVSCCLLAGSCVFSMTFTGIGGQVPIFSCFSFSLEHPLLKEPDTEQQAKLEWSAESWGQYPKAEYGTVGLI